MLGELATNLDDWGNEECPKLLNAGSALGETYVLFEKIEDDTIQAELEMLDKK